MKAKLKKTQPVCWSWKIHCPKAAELAKFGEQRKKNRWYFYSVSFFFGGFTATTNNLFARVEAGSKSGFLSHFRAVFMCENILNSSDNVLNSREIESTEPRLGTNLALQWERFAGILHGVSAHKRPPPGWMKSSSRKFWIPPRRASFLIDFLGNL